MEINVLGGRKLKDTEWFGTQDPYVILQYGSQKFTTKTCKDGGENPVFNDNFTPSLIEGVREMSVEVWNENSMRSDQCIGAGKVLLDKVLASGYDDRSWPLKTKRGKDAGKLRLILHCDTTVGVYPPQGGNAPAAQCESGEPETSEKTSSASGIGGAIKKLVRGHRQGEQKQEEGHEQNEEHKAEEVEGVEEEEEEEEESEESESEEEEDDE
ncbi:X-linked retinitis pigmentosa GTPase regulator-interacting protein 1 [Selaginella moellendorffii]|uniref:X-linked retinitis pigmentosa GTPase regulator-interacting protein 1 n=1 Tax=Selaginella moellendorffii TaxID=88036 RepID=UPI000D1CF75C|nr:X-linked retinitis pigmentosa GTPase regulator-interacting protein 1 [Selaginella moellendorffii]|eukprot:XP_024533166.1 X-linked retinitis pigmentosa GTPase regulator-interacting protein 1 [Selaginella moellendorffii]